MGFFFGAAFYLIFLFTDPAFTYLGIVAGVLFALALLEFMLIYEKHMEKRYAEAEKAITTPVIYKLNSNLTTPQGVRNANIYLCVGALYSSHWIKSLISPKSCY